MTRAGPYAAALLAILMALPVAAQAKPAIRDVPKIDEGLFTIGLANEIRKTCPAISARMLTALAALNDLQQTAREMGYTKAEVEAYLDSEAEKERMRARKRAYFEQKGLATDVAGHCTLGEMEIAGGTPVGRLLRMDN